MLAEVNNGVNTLEETNRLTRLMAGKLTRAGLDGSLYGARLSTLFVWLVLILTPAGAIAQEQPRLTLNPEVPLTYRVEPGDTLWDIAALYLRDPWQWQALWAENPQIENPHLIFPGDVLRLLWEDGVPRLVRQGQADIKLSPALRASPLTLAIPVIPREQIAPFLQDHSVVEPAELASLAYVVSGESGRLMSGVGDTIFVKDMLSEAVDYRLIRPASALEDPVTGENLGTLVLDLGGASVRDPRGDDELAALVVTDIRQEIRVGDRLRPVGETDLRMRYLPHAPEVTVEDGFMIAVAGGLTQIGPMDIVAVNRGARESLRVGDVLAIEQTGPSVEDPVTGGRIRLPDTRAGVLMVFAVHDRASFGLVLEANRAMRVGDSVVNP